LDTTLTTPDEYARQLQELADAAPPLSPSQITKLTGRFADAVADGEES
jgi:hypothetical protein